MSNPFNPFQTRSTLRFPPGAQEKLCKLLIFKHLQSFSFLCSPNLVAFGHILKCPEMRLYVSWLSSLGDLSYSKTPMLWGYLFSIKIMRRETAKLEFI